jgi:hypothetical protein
MVTFRNWIWRRFPTAANLLAFGLLLWTAFAFARALPLGDSEMRQYLGQVFESIAPETSKSVEIPTSYEVDDIMSSVGHVSESSPESGAPARTPIWRLVPKLWAWIYLLSCPFALLGFAFLGRHRRLLSLLFGLLFLFFHLQDPTVGWVRVTLAVVTPLVVTFVYESFRKNA